MVYLMPFPKIQAPDNFYQYSIWYIIGAIITIFFVIYFIWTYGINFLQGIFSIIFKLICMPWLKIETVVTIDPEGNITKRETFDATLGELIENISYLISAIVVIATSILIMVFCFFTISSIWNSKTDDVVANMHSAIIQGKSNSDLEVKPYKKVFAIKKSDKLQDYLATMQNDSNQNVNVVGVKSLLVLVKYADHSQEWFKNKHVTLKVRYVKEDRPMTVAVYKTKITKKAMSYVQLNDTLRNYNNRQVVITKYVKKKPVNWQAVK